MGRAAATRSPSLCAAALVQCLVQEGHHGGCKTRVRAAAYLRVTPQGQGHDEPLKKKIQGQIERRTARRQGAAETMQRWRGPRRRRGGSAGGGGGERSYGQGLQCRTHDRTTRIYVNPTRIKNNHSAGPRFVELSIFCELNALSSSKSTQQ